MEEKREDEARYYQDKETLDKNNKSDGLFTELDLQTLNILPENYIKWKEIYERKKFVNKIKEYIKTWSENWENNRGEVLAQLKKVAKENGLYTETELKDWLNEEIRKNKQPEKDEEENEYEEDIDIEKSNYDIIKKYLSLLKDKKFGDASEILVNLILKKFKIYTTKDDIKTEVWIYKDGIYVPQGKSEIKEYLRRFLGKFYSQFVYGLVMNKLEPDTFIDIDKFFIQSHLEEIPVLNGILNITTRELKPFSPEKIFFNKIPVSYDKEADCPQIDKFLSDVLSNQDDKIVFYELGGFILLREYKFEKAFMFVGDGRNGKDKSIELLKRMLGLDNCCSVPLSSLVPDSFIISEFFGKMVNVAGEVNNHDLKDTSMFKALTGRSLVSAPRKFLRPVTFQNHAKFVFACNELPMVYDNSKGFWDRWVLLEYPYTFLSQEEIDLLKDKNNIKLRDPDIIEKITTPEEMSGLLNKFLDGLDRLKKKKDFSSTKGSEYIKNIWIRKSNSFMAFCLDSIEDDYEGIIPKKQLRKKYIDYCKLHKITPKTDFVMKKTLQEMFGASEDRTQKEEFGGRNEYIWTGIKWRAKIS